MGYAPSTTQAQIDRMNNTMDERMTDENRASDNPEWDTAIKSVLDDFGYDTEVLKDDYRAVYSNGEHHINVWFSNSYNAACGFDDNFDGIDHDDE